MFSIDDHKQKEKTLILGEVSQESVADIIRTIYEINADDEEQEQTLIKYERMPIHLIINSYGGSVYDGLALIGAIEMSMTPVLITCLGSAMSMGMIILASGHYRRAHHLSTIMYHQLSNGVYDTLEGIRKVVAETERLEAVYENILYLRTKIKQKDLAKYKTTKSDWFMTAEEALKLGVIDEIIGFPLMSNDNLKKVKNAVKKKQEKETVIPEEPQVSKEKEEPITTTKRKRKAQ